MKAMLRLVGVTKGGDDSQTQGFIDLRYMFEITLSFIKPRCYRLESKIKAVRVS